MANQALRTIIIAQKEVKGESMYYIYTKNNHSSYELFILNYEFFILYYELFLNTRKFEYFLFFKTWILT